MWNEQAVNEILSGKKLPDEQHLLFSTLNNLTENLFPYSDSNKRTCVSQ